tara:strand:- start:549 stop:1349 length:801 start_codon:yes stop_codon:yes gene_type:complete
VSERRACQTLGVARSTFRYESVAPDDHELIALLAELRIEFDTWGYRKLTGVLKKRGHRVNHKRVYRLWKEQGWQRPRPKKKQDKPRGDKTNACHIRAAVMGNHAWAVDFVTDQIHEGKPLKILTVLDEYTREALAVEVRRHMGQKDVREVLMRLFKERGAPEFVRSDNGGEFCWRTHRPEPERMRQRSGSDRARKPMAKWEERAVQWDLESRASEPRGVGESERSAGALRAVEAEVQRGQTAWLAEHDDAESLRRTSSTRGSMALG